MSPAKSEKKGTFLAVDGTALAYRSHFAFINRPLTTRDGVVTSAVYGFIMALRRIQEDFPSDAFVVVFDAPGPTFRHEKYDEYKATRERMPEDLRSQFPRIHDYLDRAGIPRLAIEGVEADDVLASLAMRAEAAGMKSQIVSNDKDLLQIVGGGIEVIALGRFGSPPKVMNKKEVEASFGVTPGQIVDLLALTGDSSDNIPGIPGVGKKTAAKLLTEHEDLEQLLAAAESMKAGKLRENLLAGKDDVFFSRELIELKMDVEVEEPATFVPGSPDEAGLKQLFEELDFQTLKGEPPKAKASETSGYAVIDDAKELAALVKDLRKAKSFAFATETSGADPTRAELIGMAFSIEEGRAHYVPFVHQNGKTLEWDEAREILAPLLEDEKIQKWGQNVKFSVIVLRRYGVELRGVDFDTMLASYVLDPSRNSHGREDLARDRLQVEMVPRKSLTGSGKARIPITQAPLTDVANYVAEGADVTFRLRGLFEPEIHAGGLAPILEDIELPLLGVLARIESAGVRLDVDFLAKLSKRMEKELEKLQDDAWRAAGQEFNLASPKQVSELLFGTLGLKSRRRTKTGLSTNAEVLTELSSEHEAPALILRHREVAKLKSTYVDALPQIVNPATGHVHTSFNQAVAATGRLSSADPNLQNVPVRTWEGKEIRKAFVPSQEGWVLVSCDYSQIELRIMAHMAQDEPLLTAFRDDLDVHRATAALIFDVDVDAVTDEQRGQAKTINFAVMYGMGAINLGRSLSIPTREASRFIASYFERYPGVREFVDRTQDQARTDLYVETLAGRRRPIPEIASGDHRTRAFGERIAVNTPIQGTAADIMKMAMITIQEELDRRDVEGRIILTVHDELVFDCPSGEKDEIVEVATSCMENALELTVPLKVDAGFGANWSEAH